MFYKYTVGWYDSYADEEKHDQGIVWGSDYGTAANRIIYSYGNDEVFELYLKEIVAAEDENDYCLSKEDIAYSFKED